MDAFNSQTQRLRAAVERGEPLATRRSTVAGQLIVCEGCCCGRTDRGFPPLPKERLKRLWKEQQLNSAVQLTISGCLGPCDLANVACLVSATGDIVWLGGLDRDEQYDALIAWARDCRETGRFQPPPASLAAHRFTRFEAPGAAPPDCEAVTSEATSSGAGRSVERPSAASGD